MPRIYAARTAYPTVPRIFDTGLTLRSFDFRFDPGSATGYTLPSWLSHGYEGTGISTGLTAMISPSQYRSGLSGARARRSADGFGLLIECRRTNSEPDSRIFASWNNAATTPIVTDVIGPDGLSGACGIEDNDAGVTELRRITQTRFGGSAYLSCWVRNISGARPLITLAGQTCYLAAGSTADPDWKRVGALATILAGSRDSVCYPAASGVAGLGLTYFAAPQYEYGAGYPSSYIPTAGAGGVTRAANGVSFDASSNTIGDDYHFRAIFSVLFTNAESAGDWVVFSDDSDSFRVEYQKATQKFRFRCGTDGGGEWLESAAYTLAREKTVDVQAKLFAGQAKLTVDGVSVTMTPVAPCVGSGLGQTYVLSDHVTGYATECTVLHYLATYQPGP